MNVLNIFPISVQVKDRTIVVVGGGVEALNKVRLLAKTTARIVVVAAEMSVDFSAWPVKLVTRAFTPADLDGAALVFVTDRGVDGRAAIQAARAANVPVNVVDVPAACDFFTPAIIDRAPLTIAISTEGQAPVFARTLRARIEAMLAPNVGVLVALAGKLRGCARQLIPDSRQRRRFYEVLLSAQDISAKVDVDAVLGEQAGLEMLEQHAANTGDAGIVWLIGAGPGAEDLLTLRAQRLLQEADVIVHDQLVPELVVQMGRRDAERVPVGKVKGHHSISQNRINALIIKLAKKGKKVARLKAGDPMVLGRAGEEIAALRKAGVTYQIVPGVTAALAAAADTATPVTLRKISSGFLAATAHGANDAELEHWSALALAGVTLGLYMGKSIASEVSAKLIGHGLAASTPVGIVVNAGRPGRQLFSGTLGELAQDQVKFVDGPAVILLGEAVAHGDWHTATALLEQQAMVA